MKKHPPPTCYYAIIFSVVTYRTPDRSGWIAILTDMPVREVRATEAEAIRAAKNAGLEKMLAGEGPPFAGPETELVKSVITATSEALWRFVAKIFTAIDAPRPPDPETVPQWGVADSREWARQAREKKL